MRSYSRAACSTGLGIMFVVGAFGLGADLQVGGDFGANELIDTLTVEIYLGEGDDLSEAVALDLGLGFPLWLHPLGHEDGETAPFGAAPQRADAARTLRAGSRATFTFDPDTESGADVLQNCSQLLAGVRISDIGRIGFISRGDTNWVLDGYEIHINDKLFAAHEGIGASVVEAQESARERIDELNLEIIPLETEGDDIAAFVEAGLATEEDESRLAEIRQQITPLQKERHRYERVISGSYPWFEEADFQAPGRTGEPLGEVQVTVLTDLHEGAGTDNYVYYRTGGHKFLIGSPATPMQPEAGPQTFRLDLISGPITAADIRGHALGVLGQEQPYDEVPDRWHPRRLMVEIDGRVVYDSEENELDRLSLEAIRIIPPAHFDGGGTIVENTPNARETYVWEAGKAMGLDLVNGGAAELPPEDDPAWPEPEPGLVFDEEEGWYDGFDEGFEPFPGEEYIEDEWIDEWYIEDDWYVDDDTGGPPWDGDDWDWDPPPSWLDILLGILSDFGLIDELIDEIEADPAGEPVQVEDVRFVQEGGNWYIRWDVFGDDSEVPGYLVEILLLRPHEADMLHAPAIIAESVDAGAREFPVPLAELMPLADTLVTTLSDERNFCYLTPRVIPEGEAPGNPGAARPLTDFDGSVDQHLIGPTGVYLVTDDGGIEIVTEPLLTDPADASGSGAWISGPCEAAGFTFDQPLFGYNVAMRLDPNDPAGAHGMLVGFAGLADIHGDHLAVAHVGFLGESDAGNTVTPFSIARLGSWGAAQQVNFGNASNADYRLGPIVQELNTPGDDTIGIVRPGFREHDIGDPEQPVIVLGLRVIPAVP